MKSGSVVKVMLRLVTCPRFGPAWVAFDELFEQPPHLLHCHRPRFLMLNCRACLWRCIEAVDAPAASAQRLRRHVNPVFLPRQQRLLSTVPPTVRKTGTRPWNLSEVERVSRSGQEPWKDSAVAANQKKRERAALRDSHSAPSKSVHEAPNMLQLGRRDPSMSERDWENRKRELKHLRDPLELAAFVRRQLGKDRPTEALQLVRMASHSMQCIVSWNHIIDHYLANERVNEALKVYNDVCVDERL